MSMFYGVVVNKFRHKPKGAEFEFSLQRPAGFNASGIENGWMDDY